MTDQRHADDTGPDTHEELELAIRMNQLALELRDRYYRTEATSDIDEAVEAARKAVEAAPHNSPCQASLLSDLSQLLYDQSYPHDSLCVLEDAIETARQAAQAAPKGHPDRLRYLNNLASMLFDRYNECSGTEADLMESIKASRNVVGEVPEDHSDRPQCLYQLGRLLAKLHSHTLSLLDLEQAIDLVRPFVRGLPKDHPNRHDYFHELGTMLRDHYWLSEGAVDPTEAIQVAREAADAVAEGDPNKATYLRSLGDLMADKFHFTRDTSDIDKAIEILRQATLTCQEDDSGWVSRLSALGRHINTRFAFTGSLRDLEEAIAIARRAVDNTPEDSDDLPSLVSHLASRLGKRYQRTGSLPDLNDAIAIASSCLDSTPEDHTSRGQLLHILGNQWASLYYHSGVMGDLEKSIKCARQAVDASPKQSSEWLLRLSSLGAGLYDRYRRTAAIEDLEEAVTIAARVCEGSTEGSYEWTSSICNFGSCLQERYKRSREPSDLDCAIVLARKAIQVPGHDHSDRQVYMESLSSALTLRFERTGATADLDEIVELRREAQAATPRNHVDWPLQTLNLAVSLQRRYEKTKRMGDLDEAIDFSKQAANAGMVNPRLQARYFYTVALFMSKRSPYPAPQEVHQEIASFERAALLQTQSPVQDRIRAGVSLMVRCNSYSNWQQAYEAAEIVVDLIPQLALRSLKHSDKQELLLEISLGGITSEAAGLALSLGKGPMVALNLLEKGRGVLALSLDEIHTDITLLEEKCPHLAQRFIRLREQLGGSGRTEAGRGNGESTWNPDTSRRYEAGDEFEKLLVEIRQQPGFEDFLLPPTESEVKSAAICGPIVIINTGILRCDAIIIEQHQVRSVPLPLCRRDVMVGHAMNGTFRSPQVLEWLWHCIASPVLTALGFEHPPSNDRWPRMWWVMTGLLTKFPIHAAGLHAKGTCETVIDRVISSYHTSVQAIIRNRKRPFSKATSRQAVLVAMEHTPGSPRLPFASKEIATVRGLCESMSLDPVEPEPTKQEILSHVLQCELFHFAGHAHADSYYSTESYLCLDPGRANSLTVSNLLDTNLRQTSPFLAYLSACGTGQIQNNMLADEAIHLINGFQLAGFRHVIGTLWQVKDALCVDMARITYEGMRKRGMTDESVSRGLHDAVRELRDRWLRTAQDSGGSAGSTGSVEREVKHDGSSDGSGSGDGLGDDRLLRDILSCDEEPPWPHWIPYVHYGV
ncbi:hypothetical protein ACJ41O_005646 [Fusarium nematophilum]